MCKHKELINSKSRDEWLRLIEQWVHCERDRELLKRRILDGITFDCLAEEFAPLQIDQIKRRCYAAQEQLFSHI